jgi:hypothetical protein
LLINPGQVEFSSPRRRWGWSSWWGHVRTEAELEPAFERARVWRADLLYAQNVLPLNAPRERLPELTRRARIPGCGSVS